MSPNRPDASGGHCYDSRNIGLKQGSQMQEMVSLRARNSVIALAQLAEFVRQRMGRAYHKVQTRAGSIGCGDSGWHVVGWNEMSRTRWLSL
jgi:hypothetical protein